MAEDIYDPLNEYVQTFRPRFRQVAEETFAQLAAEANVDVEANRETCRNIYATERSLSSVKSRISRWTFLCVLLWLCLLGGIAVGVVTGMNHDYQTMAIAAGVAVVGAAALFAKVHPKLKSLKTEREELEAKEKELKDKAWRQMEPLNCLYDWDILTRMMTKTVPRLEFDPYFTTQRLADLKAVYNWDDSFNAQRSVIYSHSGLINGNPFVLCRTRKMEWGTMTYYGSKTIHWTTRERGADGKYRTVHHSETLTASVTEPYPNYYEATRLIYGNTAAPDLIFYRQQSGLAGKEDSWSFKRKRRSLRKKARDLENADFAMLTNEDFEVAFNTSNRNNNQQFALLFTPLAQQSMLCLLRDKEAGYGDDFDFDKDRMINTIIPQHLQTLNLDMNPGRYRNFDFDKAKEDFYAINAECFRSIYFALAPLLCIPMYQQIRPQHDIYGRDMQRHSSFWEHEALANFWGQDHFKAPNCVTDCILKTEQKQQHGDSSTITVRAYGYRSVRRLTYVDKYGGDGRWHKVPVYWDEYLPVTGTGNMYIKEDNDAMDNAPSSAAGPDAAENTSNSNTVPGEITQHQRLAHIQKVLSESGLRFYRRHIASRV